MPVYDTSGTLLVTTTTITVRMPICYYNDDHGPIKKIQVLVAELGGTEKRFLMFKYKDLCFFLGFFTLFFWALMLLLTAEIPSSDVLYLLG